MASKTRTFVITTAVAIGVGLGGYGVASATNGAPSDTSAEDSSVEAVENDGVEHENENEGENDPEGDHED